jgi:hypothetical protein
MEDREEDIKNLSVDNFIRMRSKNIQLYKSYCKSLILEKPSEELGDV